MHTVPANNNDRTGMDFPSFLPRIQPGTDDITPRHLGRYERLDYELGDAQDLITLLTWRFVEKPQTEGDPPPDRTGYPDLVLSDDMVEHWRWWMRHNSHDERPIVTRREIIDPRATQIRTLVVNWPFSSGKHHPIGILKKIKWGTLIAQIFSGVLQGYGGGSPADAFKQITDLFGAFDVALTNLSHREAAVLTIADGFKSPEWTQRWLTRCNQLLATWSGPNEDLRMERQEFFDTLQALIARGIEVETGQPSLLTASDVIGILDIAKIRIRPMILLMNW